MLKKQQFYEVRVYRSMATMGEDWLYSRKMRFTEWESML